MVKDLQGKGLKSVERVLAYVYHTESLESENLTDMEQLWKLPNKLDWVCLLLFILFTLQEEPIRLWQLLYPEKPDATMAKENISFRATGDRNQKNLVHKFSSVDLARHFGAGVQNATKWKRKTSNDIFLTGVAKMNEYDIEVFICAFDSQLWAGIVLRDYNPVVCVFLFGLISNP
ncbi:hypothetical protein M1146_00180 [Patescibacteria group bacterium]|nr:hypothetical protein [Patescibacteria group bacterium]